MQPIYLDYNATTPVDPAVVEAMLPFLHTNFGNPSSAHAPGHVARDAIETARAQVADLIGANADEIIFTSGGTEASNMAIAGAASRESGRRVIVTTAIEHPATEATCAAMEQRGYSVRRIVPRADGRVDPATMTAAIGADTALVSVIHAQNEIGTLQPVTEIAAAARRHGALMHADAAQSLGKIKVDVRTMGVDLLSIAGHKLYAPKGIGALYARRGVQLQPILFGAGQEHGRRPGTENVAGIVALGRACVLAAEHLQHEQGRLAHLRDRLLADLQQEIPGLKLAGHSTDRLPNTLNVLFPGVSGRVLLQNCPHVLASTGSACHADREDPSAILLAMGIPAEEALGAVRLSLGRYVADDDIAGAVANLVSAWRPTAQTNPANKPAQKPVKASA